MRLLERPSIMPKTSPGGQRKGEDARNRAIPTTRFPRRHSRASSRITIAIVSGLLLVAGTLAWGAPPQPASLKVAATIFPLYDLVQHVAGPSVEVILLVRPGTRLLTL